MLIRTGLIRRNKSVNIFGKKDSGAHLA
jgi:hypothetical protein